MFAAVVLHCCWILNILHCKNRLQMHYVWHTCKVVFLTAPNHLTEENSQNNTCNVLIPSPAASGDVDDRMAVLFLFSLSSQVELKKALLLDKFYSLPANLTQFFTGGLTSSLKELFFLYCFILANVLSIMISRCNAQHATLATFSQSWNPSLILGFRSTQVGNDADFKHKGQS